MKRITQKITTLIMTLMMGIGMIAPAIQAAPTYAASPTTTFGAEAAILKDCASKSGDGKGGGIICVILLVVDILAVLVGIIGVIGIVIVGIQYLTAGGNEEQTRKAKRRLFEIVIGILAYVIIYALLKWLLPNFEESVTSALNITIGA